jgi:hypothetical protein
MKEICIYYNTYQNKHLSNDITDGDALPHQKKKWLNKKWPNNEWPNKKWSNTCHHVGHNAVVMRARAVVIV